MSTCEGAAPWDPEGGTTGGRLLNSKRPTRTMQQESMPTTKEEEHGHIRTSQKVAPPATETTTHLYPCTIIPTQCQGARPIFVIQRAQGCPGSCEGIAHRAITCRRVKAKSPKSHACTTCTIDPNNTPSNGHNDSAEFTHDPTGRTCATPVLHHRPAQTQHSNCRNKIMEISHVITCTCATPLQKHNMATTTTKSWNFPMSSHPCLCYTYQPKHNTATTTTKAWKSPMSHLCLHYTIAQTQHSNCCNKIMEISHTFFTPVPVLHHHPAQTQHSNCRNKIMEISHVFTPAPALCYTHWPKHNMATATTKSWKSPMLPCLHTHTCATLLPKHNMATAATKSWKFPMPSHPHPPIPAQTHGNGLLQQNHMETFPRFHTHIGHNSRYNPIT